MATNINLDLNAWFASAQEQFTGLNPNEPGQWPWLPKTTAFLAAGLAALGLGWFLLISDQVDLLEAARNKEPALKADYKDKLAQAVNLPE
ncbi:MAG TPA: pilus assembly protein PilO, partial [Aquabacterium sp.]|nr:pilus assembly protein PilO [Aquabacterium sp.]